MKRIKQFLYNRFQIWWHSQNLNDDYGVKGAMWRHGRGWLHLTPLKTELGLEWTIFRRNGFDITINLNDRGESEVMLTFGLPYLFTIYFTIENYSLFSKILPGKWVDSINRRGEQFWMPVDRKVGIEYHHNTIWISLWDNPMEWNKSDPWWWAFSINIPDLILGKQNYSKIELDSGTETLYFKEGGYSIEWTKILQTWKRSRWFAETRLRFNFEMDDNPIPIPGKGENSWDIDDDAIFSSGIPAKTLHEALGRLTSSVLRSRIRYGSGTDWIPDKVKLQ